MVKYEYHMMNHTNSAFSLSQLVDSLLIPQ